MSRTRRRIYNEANLISVTGMNPSTSTGIVALHHVAPNSTQETFLRCRAEAQVTVLVNAPGFNIPPEFWWGQSFAVLYAHWLPSNSAVLQTRSGSSSNYLGSVTLKPERFPLETNAGEYVVKWTSEEPLITETARKSLTAVSGPGVLFQLGFYDPQFVFSNFWSDVNIDIMVRAFTLWEDP
jgi:hypothetical protein